jgi:hypothetical protein
MTKHVGRGLEIDEAERIEAIRHAGRDVMRLHVRVVAGLTQLSLLAEKSE